MSKRIKLTKGKFAIVDDDDYSYLNRFKWYASESSEGANGLDWYATRRGGSRERDGFCVRMSDFLVSVPNGYRVFHRNKNTLDNRRVNLTAVPFYTSIHNQRKKKNTTSVYKGVCWNKNSKKWVSAVVSNKKRYWLGSFKSEKEAALAYNKKAEQLYGEFAYQNIVI
jgi:hypothetical protein